MVGKTELIMVQLYRHAKQMKRSKKSMNKLKTYLGQLIRDIERKAVQMEGSLKEVWLKANQIRNQRPKVREKLLSWHAPEVECILKGKSHKAYEFGCKVSVITTSHRSKGGMLWHQSCYNGNPYDDHTLKSAG